MWRILLSSWGLSSLKKYSGSLYYWAGWLKFKDSSMMGCSEWSLTVLKLSSLWSSLSEESKICWQRWQKRLDRLSSSLRKSISRSKLETYSLCWSLDRWAASLFFSFWILARSSLVSLLFSSLSCPSLLELHLSLWIGRVLLVLFAFESLFWLFFLSWLSVISAKDWDYVYSFI